MSDVIKFPEREDGNYGVEFIGPFTECHKVTSGGYRVPNLTAIVTGENVVLNLDERFMIEATRKEASKWIWFIANAMAIGAGYSCHGENSVKPNPFNCRMISVTEEEIP